MCIGSAPPVPTTTTKERGPLTKFLYEKTGVTGSWTLGLGLAAFLISKEYYVVNSEVYMYLNTYASLCSIYCVKIHCCIYHIAGNCGEH